MATHGDADRCYLGEAGSSAAPVSLDHPSRERDDLHQASLPESPNPDGSSCNEFSSVYEVGEVKEKALASSLLSAVSDAVRALREALRPTLSSVLPAAEEKKDAPPSPTPPETSAEEALASASLRSDVHHGMGAKELFSSSADQLWGRCSEISDFLEISSGPGTLSSLVHEQLQPLKGESARVRHAVDQRVLGVRQSGAEGVLDAVVGRVNSGVRVVVLTPNVSQLRSDLAGRVGPLQKSKLIQLLTSK